jgi:hypothetical protein
MHHVEEGHGDPVVLSPRQPEPRRAVPVSDTVRSHIIRILEWGEIRDGAERD